MRDKVEWSVDRGLVSPVAAQSERTHKDRSVHQENWLQIHRLQATRGLTAVKEFIDSLRGEPEQLEILLPNLIDRALESKTAGELLNHLISPGSIGWLTLKSVQFTGELSQRLNRVREFRLNARALVHSSRPPLIQLGTRLKLGTPSDWLRREIMRLKYVGVDRPTDVSGAIASARQLAGRISIPSSVLNFLYKHSKSEPRSFERWAEEVKTACAIEEITQDGGYFNEMSFNWRESVQCDSASWPLDPDKGALFVVHHGGYMRIRLEYYMGSYSTGMFLGAYSSHPRCIKTAENARSALFVAFKALKQKKSIFIGIDANLGSSFTTVSILGKPVPIGTGAAFLAYEAHVPFVWLMVGRTDERFVPMFWKGPQRTRGESYAEYLARFLAFCKAMLEDYFTGHPVNLSLKHFWIRHFRED
jgi:hypothetical protein